MNRTVTTLAVALALQVQGSHSHVCGQDLAPLRNLPPYMRVLVDWGVRPEWSLDGKSLVFMERGLGDAYRLDVETGRIMPLTAHFYNHGFDRVLPLVNGDYLLTGPRVVDPSEPWKQRHTAFEMFVGTNRQWKIDVYRLALDGSNRADRMTFFQSGDSPYHGSNPVVSPDGRWAAVQLGIHGMGAGQGRGLVLIDLAAWERTLR